MFPLHSSLKRVCHLACVCWTGHTRKLANHREDTWCLSGWLDSNFVSTSSSSSLLPLCFTWTSGLKSEKSLMIVSVQGDKRREKESEKEKRQTEKASSANHLQTIFNFTVTVASISLASSSSPTSIHLCILPQSFLSLFLFLALSLFLSLLLLLLSRVNCVQLRPLRLSSTSHQ